MKADAAAFAVARLEAFGDSSNANEQMAVHTAAVDEIVSHLFTAHLAGRSTEGLTLVALGGYGRRELAPYSDLDLLIVHRGWSEDDIAELNRAVMYPLWDAGCDVGNRVRTIPEMMAIVSRLDEATAVIDARLITGDERLFADAMVAVGVESAKERAGLLRELREATATRHAAHGHAGHLLEPDIRDSAGGLRDIQTMGWISAVTPGPDGLDGLIAAGVLSEGDRLLVTAADSFLKRVRVAMHLRAERRVDTLYLSDQDEIADLLDYTSSSAIAAGDVFMRDLFAHARNVSAICQAVAEATGVRTSRRRFSRRPDVRTVEGGYVIKSGRLEVVAAPAPRDDPSGWMNAFVSASAHNVLVGRTSVARLREMVRDQDASWNAATLDAFQELLLAGPRARSALESLDASGLMSALIGCWEHVRSLPQRNLYHRYTVDVHLQATVCEAAESRDSSDPEVVEAWSHVGDPVTVLLACLFHDIGKGRDGDHSELGAIAARDALHSMGVAAPVTEDVCKLIRDHLVLAETATRRDISDARIVQEFAARIGDARMLSMLYLLTRADAIATGPEAWSTFRASLVRELYQRGLATLGLSTQVQIASVVPEWLDDDALDAREVRTHLRRADAADDLVVTAPDRPGMFAAVTGVLAMHGVNVLAAEVVTIPESIAVEAYKVRGSHGPVPDDRWEKIRNDIAAALDGTLDIDRALSARKPQRRVASVRRPTYVVVDDTGDGRTLVEVHAADSPGLLRRIARVLSEHRCEVHLARIATYGTEVVDVFYVTNVTGGPLDSTARTRLMSALSGTADR